MALITCPDCTREISDQAPSCPGCGRPNVAGTHGDGHLCPTCGAHELRTGTGLHGFGEITVVILLATMLLIPAFLFFFYMSPKPWCAACHLRPERDRPNPWTMAVLIGLLGLWAIFLIPSLLGA